MSKHYLFIKERSTGPIDHLFSGILIFSGNFIFLFVIFLSFTNWSKMEPVEINEIPLLLTGELVNNIPGKKRLVLFLDFDGTLSPIVSKPDDAKLLPGMKEVLEKCALKYDVALVSGRDTDDVMKRVGIEGLIYAGSHGFSIKGPGNLLMEHEKADEIVKLLGEIERRLEDAFSDGPAGVQVERKKYAITVHYRNARADDVDGIKLKTGEVVSGITGVKREMGKKIVEIKPDIDWHKGKAVKWIMEQLGLWSDPGVLPLYLGDDSTDEDAFKMLKGKGVGVIVGSHEQPSIADYRLHSVEEVKQFLDLIA